MRAKSFQYRPLIQSAALPAPTATSELVPAINSEDPCGFYPLASSRRSSSPVHDPSIQIGWILRTVFLESLKFRASVIVDSSNQMISTCSRVFSTTGSFSTRRAEIETAMAEHGLGRTGDRPHLAARATLMTRAHKRDVDRGELRRDWERQASDLGFSPETVRAGPSRGLRGQARSRQAVPSYTAEVVPFCSAIDTFTLFRGVSAAEWGRQGIGAHGRACMPQEASRCGRCDETAPSGRGRHHILQRIQWGIFAGECGGSEPPRRLSGRPCRQNGAMKCQAK